VDLPSFADIHPLDLAVRCSASVPVTIVHQGVHNSRKCIIFILAAN